MKETIKNLITSIIKKFANVFANQFFPLIKKEINLTLNSHNEELAKIRSELALISQQQKSVENYFAIHSLRNVHHLVSNVDLATTNKLCKELYVSKALNFGLAEVLHESSLQGKYSKLYEILKKHPPEEFHFNQSFINKINTFFENKKNNGFDSSKVKEVFSLSDSVFYSFLSTIKLTKLIFDDTWKNLIKEIYFNKQQSTRITRRFASFLISHYHLSNEKFAVEEKAIIEKCLQNGSLDLNDLNLLLQNSTTFSQKGHLIEQNIKTCSGSSFAEPSSSYLVKANIYSRTRDISWLSEFTNYLQTYHLRGPIPKTVATISDIEFAQQFQSNTSSTDLVSIGMPAYNSAVTLKYAVQSILNQSHENIELIIIDDCSKDDTEKVARELLKQDTRVKYHRNKINVGPYVSRNIALKIAKGKYFTINDADDISHPDRISDHIEYIKRTNADFVESRLLRLTHDLIFISDIKGNFCRKNLSSIFFERAKVIEKFGYWENLRFGADSEFEERMITMGAKKVTINKPYLYALYGASNLTTTKGNVLRGAKGARSLFLKSYRKHHLNYSDSKLRGQLKRNIAEDATDYFIPEEMRIDSKIVKKILMSFKG